MAFEKKCPKLPEWRDGGGGVRPIWVMPEYYQSFFAEGFPIVMSSSYYMPFTIPPSHSSWEKVSKQGVDGASWKWNVLSPYTNLP